MTKALVHLHQCLDYAQAFEQKQFVYIENLTDSIAWSIMLSAPPENREERERKTTLALIFFF